MKTIDPIVSNYIDVAIERERKLFKHDLQVEREIIQDDIKRIAEMVNSKPGREEVREIVREEMAYELRPIKAEMSMYREELLDHRARIEALERVG